MNPKDEDFLKHVAVRRPYPLKHMRVGGGLLPDTDEAAALWQFLLGAHQALDKIPAQVTLEGDTDLTANLRQIADSARKLFGLSTLEGMFNAQLIWQAKLEAKRSALYWNVKLDAWFESGGRASNELDRDPDHVGLH